METAPYIVSLDARWSCKPMKKEKDVKTFKQTYKNYSEWVLEEEEEIISITLLWAKESRYY